MDVHYLTLRLDLRPYCKGAVTFNLCKIVRGSVLIMDQSSRRDAVGGGTDPTRAGILSVPRRWLPEPAEEKRALTNSVHLQQAVR